MDLGPRITAWRRAKGWNQKQLAEKIDVSRASVCQWEAGVQYPKQQHQQALIDAFGVTPQRFFGPLPRAKRTAA